MIVASTSSTWYQTYICHWQQFLQLLHDSMGMDILDTWYQDCHQRPLALPILINQWIKGKTINQPPQCAQLGTLPNKLDPLPFQTILFMALITHLFVAHQELFEHWEPPHNLWSLKNQPVTNGIRNEWVGEWEWFSAGSSFPSSFLGGQRGEPHQRARLLQCQMEGDDRRKIPSVLVIWLCWTGGKRRRVGLRWRRPSLREGSKRFGGGTWVVREGNLFQTLKRGILLLPSHATT